MSDIRKPDLVFLLNKKGKKLVKIGLYNSDLWPEKNNKKFGEVNRYRLKVNGRWWRTKEQKYIFQTKWEFRDLLWRSLSIHI